MSLPLAARFSREDKPECRVYKLLLPRLVSANRSDLRERTLGNMPHLLRGCLKSVARSHDGGGEKRSSLLGCEHRSRRQRGPQ
jgi:hypothetical protein